MRYLAKTAASETRVIGSYWVDSSSATNKVAYSAEPVIAILQNSDPFAFTTWPFTSAAVAAVVAKVVIINWIA